MKTYHNDPKLKEAVLKKLQHHYDADNIVKGQAADDAYVDAASAAAAADAARAAADNPYVKF